MLRRFTSSALFTLACVTLAGCQLGTAGDEGDLRFRDMTRYRAVTLFPDRKLERPIALGAKITVEVTTPFGSPVQLVSAEASPEDVIEMEVSSSRLQITAKAEGVALIDIEAKGNVDDNLQVEVLKPAEWSLIPSPWTSLIPLPSSLWASGLSVLTQSRMTVYGEALSAGGVRLLGHSSASFELSDEAAATVTVKNNSDECTLETGESTGEATLSFGDKSLKFAVVTKEAIAELKTVIVDDKKDIELGANAEVQVSPLRFLHIAAFDSDGGYIAGDGSMPLSIESSDASIIKVEASSSDDELATILQRGRAAVVSFKEPGEATLTITWAEQTLKLPLKVVE